MCGVIELARKDLDNCSVKSRKNISSIEMELCIKSTKEAIRRCNSFMDISTHIHNVFNDNTDDTANRLWHCIAFSKHGGESLVTSKQYCHLVCGLLHIEVFSTVKSRVVGVSDEELDEFICGICLEVFVNPVVTQCCQQTYCNECIHWWLSDHNTCPNDRKSLSREVKCDFYANGCESVVKMCELSQHINSCDYNPNRKCATCQLPIDRNIKHNCIENLLILNNSLCDEIKRISSENHKLSMKGVIELTRKDLEKCLVRQNLGMSVTEVNLCIERAKEAIRRCDTYLDIATHLSQAYNNNNIPTPRKWHCIVFSSTGGQSLKRVIGVCDEELDEYTCGICLEVFVDPVVTQCCRQTYCSECINGWLSDHNTCPNDGKPLSVSPAPRVLVNLLNKMHVKCHFNDGGCESVVKMCELAQHMNESKPDYDKSKYKFINMNYNEL
ncbi:unnamed protein product [Oppiella nova]|uniref:RING-type domain-containing protein n=1 Tax=Oppiella nova TaxID=334625 RepID=A0A7R9MBN4_9ACAR|nr:unnamed protein product [Oppiella nova]CAG2174185.1 unnamed protein product [Oppiella nova]